MGRRGEKAKSGKTSLPTKPLSMATGHHILRIPTKFPRSKFPCLCHLTCSHNVPGPVGITGRPTAALPPFYTKRKLRQQVVIFTSCPQRSGHLRDPKGSPDMESWRESSILDLTCQTLGLGKLSPFIRKEKPGFPIWTLRGRPRPPAPRGEGAGPCGARPHRLARRAPPAAEGALAPGRAPVPSPPLAAPRTKQGSDAPQPLPAGDRRQQGERRRPSGLQESSETYSFPTACASRRGDVTGPGVPGGQAAGRGPLGPTAPPQRAGGRDAPLLSGPAPAVGRWAQARKARPPPGGLRRPGRFGRGLLCWSFV